MLDSLIAFVTGMVDALKAALRAVFSGSGQQSGAGTQDTRSSRPPSGRITTKSAHDYADSAPPQFSPAPAPAPPPRIQPVEEAPVSEEPTASAEPQDASSGPGWVSVEPVDAGTGAEGSPVEGWTMAEPPEDAVGESGWTMSEPPEEAVGESGWAMSEPPEEASDWAMAEPPEDGGPSVAAPSPEPVEGLEATPPPSTAGPEPKPVLLGGSAPHRARPGDVILAQFVAYVAGFEPEARRLLEREAEPGEVRLDEETDCRWAVGARVTVRCAVRGLDVPVQTQSFAWDGECRTVSFDVEIPADAKPRQAVIVMEAFVHDREDAPDAVQVGRLRMTMEIGDDGDDGEPQKVKGEAARTAFASYASEDRIDVLERVSSIRRSAGLEVFLDVVSLRMGEQWEPRLREQILANDRFLLFWSEVAAGKKWVEWEWQQALDAKGEDALELHLLRHTPIDKVPARLRKFHFDDVYLLARDAELYRREQAAKKAAAGAPDA